MFISYSLCN